MRSLDQVHPKLQVAVPKILAAMEAIGFTMLVTDTLRTVDEQQALYAQGRTRPGLIVTQDDGVIHKSNHQLHDDGFGHAVDCCFMLDGKASWDAKLPWKAYGALAEALGLKWGGNWGSFHDLPHIELL